MKSTSSDRAGTGRGKTADNPFDVASMWPPRDDPRIDIGMMERNCNAANYFAEIALSSADRAPYGAMLDGRFRLL